jgi:dyslexia susceptibility 1 candidate gene 1 protein
LIRLHRCAEGALERTCTTVFQEDKDESKEDDPSSINRPPADHPDYYGKGFQAGSSHPPADALRLSDKAAAGHGYVCNTSTKASFKGEVIWNDGSDTSTSLNGLSDDETDKHFRHDALDEGGQSLSLVPPPRSVLDTVKVRPMHSKLGCTAWPQNGACGYKTAPRHDHSTFCLQIEFTKLEFPHLPAREKREEEIRLYKKMQHDAQAHVDSLDITDRQPVFLKDKGDAMFKQCNFHAALNAYSAAIAGEGEESILSLTCRCRPQLAFVTCAGALSGLQVPLVASK